MADKAVDARQALRSGQFDPFGRKGSGRRILHRKERPERLTTARGLARRTRRAPVLQIEPPLERGTCEDLVREAQALHRTEGLPFPDKRFIVEAPAGVPEPAGEGDDTTEDAAEEHLVAFVERPDEKAVILNAAVKKEQKPWWVAPHGLRVPAPGEGDLFDVEPTLPEHYRAELDRRAHQLWPDGPSLTDTTDVHLLRAFEVTFALLAALSAGRSRSGGQDRSDVPPPPTALIEAPDGSQGRRRRTVRIQPYREPPSEALEIEQPAERRKSPRAHTRRGYTRRGPNGQWVTVKPTVVGVPPEEREAAKARMLGSTYRAAPDRLADESKASEWG